MVDLDLRGTCTLCGTRVRGIGVVQVRVNRRSLRGSGRPSLFFADRDCHECRFETDSVPRVHALTAESQAKVTAYRKRRWAA